MPIKNEILNMHKKKRLLISSYANSPVRGSECAVGWEICSRLASYFEVTVLVCEKTPSGDSYYNEIKEYCEINSNSTDLNFVPVPMPLNSLKYSWLHDHGFWPAYYWGYKCWQKAAYKNAVELHRLNPYDIVYQLNMIGFREPGYLWKLNIPFLWGPTNGFHSIPFSFIRSFKGKEFFIQSIKHISNEIQILTSIRPKQAAKKAELVWCVDQVAYNKLKKWRANVELLQETGLSVLPDRNSSLKKYDGKRKLNIVWSGMITPGKALFILIEALIKIKELNFELTIIGDGILKETMQQISLPISDKIEWVGWVTKYQAMQLVSDTDLLIHTSLKEGTPHSILEAIGLGVPVICHNTCGMGIVVNDKNGFKIPYIESQTSINSISKLIVDIINNPQILNDKFQTIWETTTNLTWDSKVEQIAKSIENILILHTGYRVFLKKIKDSQ